MATPVSKLACPADPSSASGAVSRRPASLKRVLERLVDEMSLAVSDGARPFERIAGERIRAVLPDFIAAWSTPAFLDLPQAPQRRAENNYGSPTITLYRDERFRVELIFWGAGPEVYVHDHVEPGAFGVVRGARIHSGYTFEPSAPTTGDIEIGRLRSRCIDVLAPGSVVEIPPGDGLIHSLFYPDTANVTLSVRKTAENWRDAGLSRFYVAPNLRMAMISDATSDRFSDFLRREIEEGASGDSQALLAAYCRGDRSRILRLLLTDWVNASPGIYQSLLAIAQSAFNAHAPQVTESLEHFRRSFLYRATHDRLATEQSAIVFLILADVRLEDAVSVIDGLRRHASLELRQAALEELSDLSLTLDGQRIAILEAGQVAAAKAWFTEQRS
jgi:predicted metal-dependent enzyme (double-stranded beta helix superfamily)